MKTPADAVADKLSFAQFIRYIGPGVVLFCFSSRTSIDIFKLSKYVDVSGTTPLSDKVFLSIIFIVLSVLIYCLYHALVYYPFLILKDFYMKRLPWANYRQLINSKLKADSPPGWDDFFAKIKWHVFNNKAYRAEWIWRETRRHFDVETKYRFGRIGAWASTNHVLYFTSVACFIYVIGECANSQDYGYALALTVLIFFGVTTSDIWYERTETYVLEELMDDQKADFDKFLEHINKSRAYLKPTTSDPEHGREGHKIEGGPCEGMERVIQDGHQL